MLILFTKIEWDTDGEDVDLPTEVELVADDDTDVVYEGADLLSDKYGWCVINFEFEINPTTN